MIDHVSFGVRDIKASTAFYRALLEPLGYHVLVESDRAVAFGKRYPEIWINARPNLKTDEDGGAHVCLRARTEDAVRAFHAAALEHGGRCDGAPGPREAAFTTYFAAFVRDPDDNKIEAASFPEIPAGGFAASGS
ncbi:MAG: VOC family protein [Maricaulaceae bacterium]|jgi:catechol 2,3-dioxygenase-like lactoylglutathione lyase family enzyme